MNVFSTPLGLGINDNPVVDSPFIQEDNIGFAHPPIGSRYLLTEDGKKIQTENGEFLLTD